MDPLLIHIHVPKCAGTTVEKHLERQLGKVGFWSPPKRSRKVPLEIFGRKYHAIPPGCPEQVRAISGHFVGRSIEKLFPERRIIRSITLRNPDDLMLSYYNYRSALYLSENLNAYSFALFMRSTRMNLVAHFLLERWFELPWVRMVRMSDDEKAALLDTMLGALDYVVDISETDALISSLSRELGVAEQAPRANVTAERAKNMRWKLITFDELSEKDRLLLESRTALDRYLWRRWALKEDVVFNASSPYGFLFSECVRPGYQVQRRVIRRYGLTATVLGNR